MDSFGRTFYWLIAGSKGGKTRARMLLKLLSEPLNSNRLSESMRMDYKTIQYHLDLLSEHGILDWSGKNYGKVYFLSDEFGKRRELLPMVKKAAAKGSD